MTHEPYQSCTRLWNEQQTERPLRRFLGKLRHYRSAKQALTGTDTLQLNNAYYDHQQDQRER